MPLPELTHLQFLVLTVLLDSERSGRYIREQLIEQGVSKTLAAFYQLMARLEEADFIEGWYVQEVVDGIPIKERHYRALGTGAAAWERARDFYLERSGLGLQGTRCHVRFILIPRSPPSAGWSTSCFSRSCST
jgi:hypothetical protein